MPNDLSEDLARRVAQNARRLVPEEGQTGHVLAVTGQSPFSTAFQQPPDDDIPRYPGSPDGVLAAPIDSLVRNTVDHTLWINTDGDTAWSELGADGEPGPSGILGILWSGSNTLLSEDTFTTTWGTTNGAGSLDPLTWSTNNGTWTVGSGQAQTSVVFLAPARAWVDLATGDFDVSLTVATRDSDSGLLFRYSSATDYWSLDCNTSFVRVRKVLGGTPTTIGATHTSADGDVIRVATFGPWIAALRKPSGGAFEIQELIFDGHNMTQGNVGMLTGTTSGRFDNFSARTP